MPSIYLVSCVSKKRDTACPAADLYTSAWFLKARRYVQGHLMQVDSWYILSAEYGLLDPDREVRPYEKTLNNMAAAARWRWAEQVWTDLKPILNIGDTIVILAGQRYREHLEPWLKSADYSVSVPMRGLPIGKQLAWLDDAYE